MSLRKCIVQHRIRMAAEQFPVMERAQEPTLSQEVTILLGENVEQGWPTQGICNASGTWTLFKWHAQSHHKCLKNR